MAGQVREWPPTEHRAPAGLKLPEVEIAQPRNLDLERIPIRECRTDLDTRHVSQAAASLDCRLALAPSAPTIR